MILLVDNYDSFVHNLARYFRRLGQATEVVRNDALTVSDVAHWRPQAIVISPGPCGPAEAGQSLAIVRHFAETIPLLGVCLGHQTIAAAWGGQIVRARESVHGRASRIRHDRQGLFAGLPPSFLVGRYHSLVAAPTPWPAELITTAWTDDGTIMALAHRRFPVFGVQFHPESVLTEYGFPLLANFLRIAGLALPDPLPSADDEAPPASTATPLPDRPVTF